MRPTSTSQPRGSIGLGPARVLVVDPEPATRARLKRLLGGQVVGEAASVDGGVQAVVALRPTVILTAPMLEGEPGAGLRLAVEAAAVDPNVQAVLHAAPTDRPSALLTAVRAANEVYAVLASERRSAEQDEES
jgi:DNA-binding NarL/FixJ family response regulator